MWELEIVLQARARLDSGSYYKTWQVYFISWKLLQNVASLLHIVAAITKRGKFITYRGSYYKTWQVFYISWQVYYKTWQVYYISWKLLQNVASLLHIVASLIQNVASLLHIVKAITKRGKFITYRKSYYKS